MNIETFTDLYHRTVDPGKFTSAFISGHLVIEFLLRKLIQQYDPALTVLSNELNHTKLIRLNRETNRITQKQYDVLVSINKIRNKFAHQITFEPSLSDLIDLFENAIQAFSDFTDGLDQGLGELRSIASTDEIEDWVIPEFFVQISYDLHNIYQNNGGDIEEF